MFLEVSWWPKIWVCVLLSHVQLSATLWTVACQAPLSMEFSRQEYWSGLLFPSPGDLPDPGTEPTFPALQADSLPSELPGKSKNLGDEDEKLSSCTTVTVLILMLWKIPFVPSLMLDSKENLKVAVSHDVCEWHQPEGPKGSVTHGNKVVLKNSFDIVFLESKLTKERKNLQNSLNLNEISWTRISEGL